MKKFNFWSWPFFTYVHSIHKIIQAVRHLLWFISVAISACSSAYTTSKGRLVRGNLDLWEHLLYCSKKVYWLMDSCYLFFLAMEFHRIIECSELKGTHKNCRAQLLAPHLITQKLNHMFFLQMFLELWQAWCCDLCQGEAPLSQTSPPLAACYGIKS